MYPQPVLVQSQPLGTTSLRSFHSSITTHPIYQSLTYQPLTVPRDDVRKSISSSIHMHRPTFVHPQPVNPSLDIPEDTMLIYTDTVGLLADLEERTQRDLRYLQQQVDEATKAIFETLDQVRKSAADTIVQRKNQLKEQILGVAGKIRDLLENSMRSDVQNKMSLYLSSGVETAKTQIDKAMSAEPHIFLNTGNLEQLLNRLETQCINMVSPYLANSSLLCSPLPPVTFIDRPSTTYAQSLRSLPTANTQQTAAENKQRQHRPVKGILKKPSARNSAYTPSAGHYASV